MGGRVLLTGGTGLVGADVLDRLVRDGYEVVCVNRRRPPEGPRVTWIAADLAGDPGPFIARLPAADFVVHAAAARTGPSGEELAYLRRVNVDFTAALFDWAAARSVRAVVYVSGFNLLRRPLEPVITEEHPVAPDTPYAITKHEGELALAAHANRGRFRGVCLRLSSPIPFAYDRLHDTVVKTWIDRARAGRPLTVFGPGDRTQDFVATEDIASAVVGSLQREARGTYNVASGTALTMRELAELVAVRWPVPVRFAGDDPNASERWNVSIARARADLGFTPAYTARATIERLLTAIP